MMDKLLTFIRFSCYFITPVAICFGIPIYVAQERAEANLKAEVRKHEKTIGGYMEYNRIVRGVAERHAQIRFQVDSSRDIATVSTGCSPKEECRGQKFEYVLIGNSWVLIK